ncbi:hypothetical protein CJF30_00006083 [Rutstroemia sp. NJR-2017a BBW]|nr:hypothetical protein CJF30_00006083 [Rutstroemia sp. NJR-2017a BBW]
MDQTMGLVETLVSEGIIKKSSESSQVAYCLVDIEKLRLKYFDPTKHITCIQPTPRAALHQEREFSTQTAAGENQEPVGPPHNMLLSTQPFDDDRTMTPSSLRSSSTELSSTRKRLWNDVLPSASKKRPCRELLATSPFSVRSIYP